VGRRTEKSVTDVEYSTDMDEQIKILVREAPRLAITTLSKFFSKIGTALGF
jgi:hypothetical protein